MRENRREVERKVSSKCSESEIKIERVRQGRQDKFWERREINAEIEVSGIGGAWRAHTF